MDFFLIKFSIGTLKHHETKRQWFPLLVFYSF